MRIPNQILYFTSKDSLDHINPISCLWTDLTIFFFFGLEIQWRFQIRYYTLPQMTNFDIIWYSVIFAANLYLSIFLWSSDILNFVFMNVVILVLAIIHMIWMILHYFSFFVQSTNLVIYIYYIHCCPITQVKLFSKLSKCCKLMLKSFCIVPLFIHLPQKPQGILNYGKIQRK